MYKFWLLLLLAPLFCLGQKNSELGVAFTNNQTAFPFARFSKLVSGPYHPGIELSYAMDRSTKPRHDWYQSFNAGYFYHRFLQHAITLHSQAGYRYKVQQQIGFTGALGLGYLHSIPATAVLKSDDSGNYSNAKGIGRGQVMMLLGLGTQYRIKMGRQPVSVFVQYRQQIQAPFVKSYVPLLPYNSLAIGFSFAAPKIPGR